MGGDGEGTVSATSDPDVASLSPGGPLARVEPPILPYDCLGRYTVRKLIGAGAMGQVFSAHDPELQRLVAIKVLRPRNPGITAHARFQREAQAMARLNHPNVVSIYDVGTVGAHVFVTMELLPGPTMADWLFERRSVREIVDVFLQAGRGLEAAHAASIVHRDFKPSNVMLGERVRVVDFGLARGLADDEATHAAETVLEGDITATGTRLGTPAYMAPEQRAGEPATPLSDQYAFGVSLREALTGTRSGAVEPLRFMPSWLRAIVDRATATRPEDRYFSMRELLVDLARDPARVRRSWIAAAGAAVLVGVAAIAYRSPPGAAPSCAGVESRLAGIWDDVQKNQVHAAFTRSGLPAAESTWEHVERTLDGYAARWIDMATETCRATRLEGRQSDSLMDLRMACLERRRSILGALTSLWVNGIDRDGIDAATTMSLPTIDECADATALTERIPMPSDPAAVVAIAAVRKQIDTAAALSIAHREHEARTVATAARQSAEAIGWPEVRAEAAYAEGDVIASADRPEGRAALLQAERLAAEAHDDRLVLRALVRLISALATESQDAVRALALADVADGLLRGIGPDPTLALDLLHARGDALQTAGKYRAARAIFGLDYSARVLSFGPTAPSTLNAGKRVADAAEDDGQVAEARRLGEENLAVTIAALGADNPGLVPPLINLGVTCYHAGDFEAALAYDRRALALAEKVFPPDSIKLGYALNNMAVIELDRGDIAGAEPLIVRALAIQEKATGPDHPETARKLVNLAQVRRRQGRVDEALALSQRALDIKVKAYGAEHPTVALARMHVALAHLARGDFAAALEEARHASATYHKVLGPQGAQTLEADICVTTILAVLGRCREVEARVADVMARAKEASLLEEPWIGDALVASARCELSRGRATSAQDEAGRAIAIYQAMKMKGAPVGAARWQLARAEAAIGGRAEAVATAQQAEKDIGDDFDGARDLKELRAWLRAPGPRAR